MKKKKLQIFISSTFTDLKVERQAAVEAILKAGHIPAGMELFSAGDQSQMEVIKRWIEESDVYVLILGGRYGTLETTTGLSYTELEYKYAIEKGKPFFALVMDDSLLDQRVSALGKDVLELKNPTLFEKFKTLVLTKMCRFFSNEAELRLGIFESLMNIIDQVQLDGWIKASELEDNSQLINMIEELRNEKDELLKKIRDLESINHKPVRNRNFGDFTFDDIKGVLAGIPVEIPSSVTSTGESIDTNALALFVNYKGLLTTGIFSTPIGAIDRLLVQRLVPTLINFGLVDRVTLKRGSIGEAEKFYVSTLGNRFLSLMQIELSNK